jgi:hypothetical protein
VLSVSARGRPVFAAIKAAKPKNLVSSGMDTLPTSAHSRAARKLRYELREWLSKMTPEADASTTRYAVTLTFDIDRMYRMTACGVLLNEDKVAWAKRAFAKFRHHLDRAIYGNSATRHNKELEYIPVIEGQGAKQQIHYHAIIVAPARVSLPDMTAEVRKAWRSTGIGGHQVDVQVMYSTGWQSYITEEAWTPRIESLDFDNVRLRSCPQRC